MRVLDGAGGGVGLNGQPLHVTAAAQAWNRMYGNENIDSVLGVRLPDNGGEMGRNNGAWCCRIRLPSL